MAMTQSRAAEIAREAVALADLTRAYHKRVQQFLSGNTAAAIPWGNAVETLPAYLPLAEGNLEGFPFAPGDLSNFVFAMVQVNNVFTGQAVAGADYVGSVLKVSNVRPL